MSINADMNPMALQIKEKIPTNSGAPKCDWVGKNIISVAIYKTNDMKNTQSVLYNESSHTGLTTYKDIKEGINRLVDSKGVIYDIKSANPKGRLTTLLLKVVDTNV